VGLPPTDAPMLVRLLAILPGALAVGLVVALEMGAGHRLGRPSLRLSARAAAVIAFATLCAGIALPYLVYGVRQI